MATPTIIGSTGSGPEAGWQRLFDYQAGIADGSRVALYQGPVQSLDTVIATLAGTFADIAAIEPSVSPGSAVATLRITYNAATEIASKEIRTPTVTITPLRVSVDLKGHQSSALQGHAALLPEIDAAVRSGDIDKVKSLVESKPAAAMYAQLVVAGVQSYEAFGQSLSITRYYNKAPTLTSADYANMGSVYLWSAIEAGGKSLPKSVAEPKYKIYGDIVKSYEWRLVGISPSIELRGASTVTWQWEGLQQWAAWLYPGGSWTPEAL
ncbi:MAG: hypothetical protein M0Q49_01860 [Porticoccaceae bacterium]|nr:hypothetical protein [Porticoccaceae bacterium]